MGKRLIIKNADFSANAIGTPSAPDIEPDEPVTPETPTYNEDSYVLDGLTFQLDGINKGSKSGVWQNLRGSAEYINNGAEFLANGVRFQGTAYLTGTSDLAAFYDQTDYTIEVVYSIPSELPAVQQILFSNKQNIYPSFGFNANKQLCIASNGNLIAGFTVIPTTEGIHYASANNSRLLFDGTLITSRSTNAAFSHGEISSIGGRQKTSGVLDSGFTGIIYAIRIYDRLLSEAEMGANQEVDIARFSE